jgi:hypothetical protein
MLPSIPTASPTTKIKKIVTMPQHRKPLRIQTGNPVSSRGPEAPPSNTEANLQHREAYYRQIRKDTRLPMPAEIAPARQRTRALGKAPPDHESSSKCCSHAILMRKHRIALSPRPQTCAHVRHLMWWGVAASAAAACRNLRLTSLPATSGLVRRSRIQKLQSGRWSRYKKLL